MPNTTKAIAATVLDLASPNIKPKALIAAVREKHPEASKADIVRAAFYAVISSADIDPAKADRMQAMAISGRGDDDHKKTKAPKRRLKTKRAASGREA